MFYGHIQNDSNLEILVVRDNNPQNLWSIESNKNIAVVWYQDCIAIKTSDSIQYFQGWPIPENVLTTGVFSSNFNVTYIDHGLFFVTVKGDLIEVPKIKQCKNT